MQTHYVGIYRIRKRGWADTLNLRSTLAAARKGFLAGRSCANSGAAHPISKSECRRSEDKHAMQTNLVGICRVRNEVGQKIRKPPLTPPHPRFYESSAHKKRDAPLHMNSQKTIVAHQILWHRQRVIRAYLKVQYRIGNILEWTELDPWSLDHGWYFSDWFPFVLWWYCQNFQSKRFKIINYFSELFARFHE